MTNVNLASEKLALASATAIKGSVQKVNLVCKLISGMKADTALLQLKFLRKRAAKDVHDLLYSAISNAENNHGMDVDSLYVKEVKVGKAITMKRFHARARGKGVRVIKPFSRVTICLSEKE